MPMTCVAYGCNNHFVKGCRKQFFRFPMKDPERMSKWVLAICRKNWTPSASSRICSDHFTDKDYMLRPGAMVPRLRLDAVPSVFDGFPKHLKERLEKKKNLQKQIDEQIVVICNQVEAQDTDQPSLYKTEPKETSTPYQSSKSITLTGVHMSSLPATASGTEVDQGKARATEQNQKSETEKRETKTCVVYGCSNTFFKGCKKQFFRFPVKDPEQLSKWVEAIQRKNWKPSPSNRICSDHFTDKDYMLCPGATVPRLRADAVPIASIGRKSNQMEAQGMDQAKHTEKTGQSKDQIVAQAPTETAKTKLHVIHKNESSVELKQQVKHGPAEKSRAITCVAYGCNNIFIKGCGKQFFRFPFKNPQRLSKWIQAVQSTDWKPSISSRICSDHFKDKDYILRTGTLVPQLRQNAVPSVFKVRTRIRSKTLKRGATGQTLEHSNYMEAVAGDQGTEMHRPVDHTYSAAHNEVDIPHFNPDTIKLKKKVRTLQRQIQRQRHTIKKLSERIAQLKKQ